MCSNHGSYHYPRPLLRVARSLAGSLGDDLAFMVLRMTTVEGLLELLDKIEGQGFECSTERVTLLAFRSALRAEGRLLGASVLEKTLKPATDFDNAPW